MGFRLGNYDRAQALVIDPVLVYSTYLGGSGFNEGYAIAVDASGNAYITGSTGNTGALVSDFPVTPGAFQSTNNAEDNLGSNAFVTKINPSGSALVYSTYLGGSVFDIASALAVDSAGNAYITGRVYSIDFPVTPGAFQTTNLAAYAVYNNGYSAFVTKLNPNGTALVYSTYLGGSGGCCSGDDGTGLAVDGSGNAYITGTAFSTDFPVTTGAFQTTNHAVAPLPFAGGANAFVAKLNPAGSELVYSTYLGGSTDGYGRAAGDVATGLAVDGFGNAYITGIADSVDFPVTAEAFQTTNKGAANNVTNAFVTKLNPAGNSLVYSTYLGGSGSIESNSQNYVTYGDGANALAVDSSGNAYITGFVDSPDFPVTPGAFQPTTKAACPCSPAGFVTKLNPMGSSLVYSTYLVYCVTSSWQKCRCHPERSKLRFLRLAESKDPYGLLRFV